jgi:hypothetical protein
MPCPIKGGPHYAVSFAQGGKLRSELYIDFGNAPQNASLFESFAEKKARIERHDGAPLSWEELPDRRACRIADYSDGDVTNGDEFDHYIDWFIGETVIHLAEDAYITPGEARKLAEALVELADFAEGLR